MPKQKTYETKRLILRPWRLTDFPVWIAAIERSLPKQDKFDLDPTPPRRRSRARFRRNVLRMRKEAQSDIGYVWNAFLKDSGEFIGWFDISRISRHPHQMANLGYAVLNVYRGKGYATEAVRAIVKAGLSDLKYHRLEAAIDLDNKASIRLARAAGLYREGIKKHYWFQNNRWEDQVVYIATPELFR